MPRGQRKRSRITYVPDTNILVDYPCLIPDESVGEPELYEPTMDLSEADIVIPTAVVRELSKFKGETSDRGKAARAAIRRLRALFEGEIAGIEDVYSLDTTVWKTVGKQRFAVLPIHKDFKSALPYCPSEDDMDGQIILAAMVVAFTKKGLPIDGTAKEEDVKKFSSKGTGVVLLTNDNGLAVRARVRGLMTSGFSCEKPKPYTGRRDVTVPLDTLNEFWGSQKLPRTKFEEVLPKEPRLVANEFVVMRSDDPMYDASVEESFLNVGRYDCEEDAIVPLKYPAKFPVAPRNLGQAMYAEALMNPHINVIICMGPAGSGKTYMSTIYGYRACQDGQFMEVVVVPCERHDNLGALPGDLGEKMEPDIQPIKEALGDYLLHSDPDISQALDVLQQYGVSGAKGKSGKGSGSKEPLRQRVNRRVDEICNSFFRCIHVGTARSHTFSFRLVCYDEFQDQKPSRAKTLLTRIGDGSKMVVAGDVGQVHEPYLDEWTNGLTFALKYSHGMPWVAVVPLKADEVVRHPYVRELARRLTEERQNRGG